MQIDKCAYCLKDSRCTILNVRKCNVEQCSFYKNKEQLNEEINKSWTRLNMLDKTAQSYISNKYYGDKMPWIKERDENDK
ncbi:hypothetical protein [Clostridium butyricum]|uniref:hypothetical protein n=1 Tax=Clostridium butyricum TaxID=1492 RepID=UPI00374F5BB8